MQRTSAAGRDRAQSLAEALHHGQRRRRHAADRPLRGSRRSRDARVSHGFTRRRTRSERSVGEGASRESYARSGFTRDRTRSIAHLAHLEMIARASGAGAPPGASKRRPCRSALMHRSDDGRPTRSGDLQRAAPAVASPPSEDRGMSGRTRASRHQLARHCAASPQSWSRSAARSRSAPGDRAKAARSMQKKAARMLKPEGGSVPGPRRWTAAGHEIDGEARDAARQELRSRRTASPRSVD